MSYHLEVDTLTYPHPKLHFLSWAESIHEVLEQSQAYSQIFSWLREALQDQDGEVRWAAVTELGRWRSTEFPTMILLRQALHDHDAQVRMAAVWSIARQKETGSQGVDLLSEALQDPDSRVRGEAVNELGVQQQRRSTSKRFLPSNVPPS